MNERLCGYIVLHNILYDNQFRFSEKHSSYMALNILIEASERGEAVIGLFLDFKAFTSLDHDILLNLTEHSEL